MADVFKLDAVLGLDSSGFENGLQMAKKGIGTSMKVIGAAVAAGSAAVGAFAKSAVTTGSEFDTSMSQIAATMGLTMDDIKNNVNGAGDTFQALRDKAKEMGSATNFSATEAADGLNILAMSGYDAEHSMAMIEDVLHLAAAGSMDMASAAAYVAGNMKGFNDETKDSGYYADLMAKGATLANTSVQQLGEAMSGGAASAAAYGQTAESMTVSLLRLAEQGEAGSAASTALAAAMKNLYTPTDQAADALEELGVKAYDEATGSARDFNDVVNELAAALSGMSDEEANVYKDTIFGIQGLDAFNKMTVTGIEKQEEWAEALANAGAGAGEAAKQYDTMTDNLKGDIDIFNSSMDGLKIAVSDTLTGSAREFVKFGSNAISRITEGFENGGIDGAMDVLGEVLQDAIKMLTEKLPMFLKVGTKLITAFVQGLVQNAPAIIAALMDVLPTILDTFLQMLPDILDAIIEIAEEVADGLIEMIPTLIPQIVDTILILADKLIEHLPEFIAAAYELVYGLLQGFIEALPTIIAWLPTMVQDLATGITENLPTILEAGISLFTALIDSIPIVIPALVQALPDIVSAVVTCLLDNLPVLIDAGFQLFVALIEALPEIITAIIAVVPEIIEKTKEKFKEMWPKMKEAGKELITKVGEGFKNSFSKMTSAVTELKTKISEKFTEIVDKAKTWGKDMLDNFIQGIKDKIEHLKEVVGDVAKKIKEILGFSEPEKGPLSNFHTYAPDMMDLFAKGIRDNEDVITGAIEDAFDIGEYLTGKTKPSASTGEESGIRDVSQQPIIIENKVFLEGDAKGVFKLVNQQNRINTRATGRNVLAMA